MWPTYKRRKRPSPNRGRLLKEVLKEETEADKK